MVGHGWKSRYWQYWTKWTYLCTKEINYMQGRKNLKQYLFLISFCLSFRCENGSCVFLSEIINRCSILDKSQDFKCWFSRLIDLTYLGNGRNIISIPSAWSWKTKFSLYANQFVRNCSNEEDETPTLYKLEKKLVPIKNCIQVYVIVLHLFTIGTLHSIHRSRLFSLSIMRHLMFRV